MNHKRFSNEIWERVRSVYARASTETKRPLVAAFDADGTLWETDMGENLFRAQIDAGFLKTSVSDPWAHYFEEKHAGRTRDAYVWLAQISAGYPLKDLRDFAQVAFEEKCKLAQEKDGEFIFESQRELIRYFREQGVEVWIVTASVKWAVEPGAAALGVPSDHVLGIETEVENGIITDRGIFPLTYREGKASRLFDACRQRPFFACGNTLGDLALLESATHLPFAVRSHSSKDHLCDAEDELYQIARERTWLTHTF